MTPLAANLFAAILLCAGLAMFSASIMGKGDPPKDWPKLAFLGACLTAIGLTVFFGIRYLPPNQLNTQTANNEPRKSLWQTWIK
jgi:drug/metabolite transporter (DMT)-like permease